MDKKELNEIKKHADEKIGTIVKFPVLTNQNIQFFEYELKQNKIVKDKNMVLSYFKDTSCVVNALCWMNKPYEVIVDTQTNQVI